MATSDASNKWVDPKSWDSAAAEYDNAVGRSSRNGASRLIKLADTLHPLSTPSARAIDLGAGTGSLTHLLAAAHPSLPILATDISPSMLEQLMALNTTGRNITSQVADMAAPISGLVTAGSFSHVFSTMAIQNLPSPASEGVLAQWARLLAPNGIVAIAMWDFDEKCGPHTLWAEATVAVDPSYVSPPMVPARHWTGCKELDEGLREAGFTEVRSEVCEIGFDVGKEGFLKFFLESGNPLAVDRRGSFKGDLGKVKVEMERLLDEVYEGGRKIPLSAALAVGRKPVEP